MRRWGINRERMRVSDLSHRPVSCVYRLPLLHSRISARDALRPKSENEHHDRGHQSGWGTKSQGDLAGWKLTLSRHERKEVWSGGHLLPSSAPRGRGTSATPPSLHVQPRGQEVV